MKLLDIISETTTPASVVAGPGETVYSLGRKYAVDPQTLFKLNNFNKDTKLELGQKVILSAKPQQEKPSKSGIPSAVPLKNKQPKANVQLEPQGLGATIEQAAKSNGIAGVHLANFMAQSKVETAGFKSLIEWSSGEQYEGRKDLGNIYKGDGPRFKGRGFIHLTGRGDYTRCNKDCGWENTKSDIVKNPDLVATDVNIAVKTALWYWDLYIRPNYKATSIVAVSTRVNGTNPNGLTARINAFKDYCAKLGIRIQNIVTPIRKSTKHAELDPAGDTQVAANDTDDNVIQTDLAEDQTEQFCPNCGGSLSEEGKASRALCTSGRPDSALGASQLASCKSQGLRARDGEKSHLITHGARKVRVTVGGKKIKGKRYGGPLPDYGTRKNQLSEADAPKVYAIGDSHAEGLSYTKGIINYAHGGQPSTSNTNYSGNYNGHPTGIENVPDGSFVVISQGCNDAANSSRAYQDSRGKTPLVSLETIASHVSKLVHAAEAKRCKVVFVLFPNGDAKIKPYYGGPYQAKVREAIKSAVGVPVIDLEGSTLSDGVHAIPADYKNAGSKVLSVFKIINEELSVPWNKTDMANKDIEIVMHNLGYKNVDLGKGFDPETRKAFRDFQVRHGLEDKGIPDDGTITYLNNMIQKYPLIATGTSFYGKPAITKPAPAATGSGPVKKDPVSKPDVTSTTNKPTGVGSITPVPDKNNTPQETPHSTITNNPVGPKEIEAALLKWPGMTKYHLQGIMANIGAESKYNVASFAPHDPPDNPNAGPAGGLFQWHGSRYNNFIKTVPDWRTNWPDQLAFAFSEAETAHYLGRKFPNGYAASAAWTTDWEKPADSLAQAIKRANYWLPRLARQLGWKD